MTDMKLSENSRFECWLTGGAGRWRWFIFERGAGLLAEGRRARTAHVARADAIRAWRRLGCWRARR